MAVRGRRSNRTESLRAQSYTDAQLFGGLTWIRPGYHDCLRTMVNNGDGAVLDRFRGRPFSAVFRPETRGGKEGVWRLVGSGVRGPPKDAETNETVVATLEELGFGVDLRTSHNPFMGVGAWTYLCRLIGEDTFYAETGDYMFAPKGAWVSGARSTLALALVMGVRVRPAWRETHNLGALDDATLIAELQAGGTEDARLVFP